MINGDHNNGFFQFSGSMGSVSSLSMKLPMLIWLEDRCYATAICNETIQTFWWISSKRPPKINNDNHKRLSPAWWIVPYTVICEEVVNSIFVFLCVFYLNQVERTCSQIEFTSSDRGSEYFDMLICEVEYFHSLYCNKLLLNNKYLYSAFHHFDRHSSEFYSSRTIYIGLKLWFTNEIIWFLIILLYWLF